MGDMKIVKRWSMARTAEYEVTLTVGQFAAQLGMSEDAVTALLEAGALMNHPAVRNANIVTGAEVCDDNLIDVYKDHDIEGLSVTLEESW